MTDVKVMSVTFLLPAGRSRDRDRFSHGSDVPHDYISQLALDHEHALGKTMTLTSPLDINFSDGSHCVALQQGELATGVAKKLCRWFKRQKNRQCHDVSKVNPQAFHVNSASSVLEFLSSFLNFPQNEGLHFWHFPQKQFWSLSS